MTEAHWTLGVLIGLPLWLIWLAACIVFALWCFHHWRKDRSARSQYYREDATFLRNAGLGALGVFLVSVLFMISPMGYWPLKAEYHQWRPVHGEVQAINKRLIGNGKSGMSERYVFVINGQPYGVDDTRASVIKIGDQVSLSCKRDWQYASVPGYVCRWNQ